MRKFIGLVTVMSIVAFISSYLTSRHTAEEGISIPIANRPNLIGNVIRPLSVVRDGESILVVDTNHKLYSLLGVNLESGLSLDNMVGKDLVIYKKGQIVCIGIKEPEVKAVPTQIGYTNK